MDFKKISLMILCVLLFIILLQNTQVVEIRLLFWKISMSRIIVLLLTLLVGFVFGFLVAKRQNRQGKIQAELSSAAIMGVYK